MDRFCLQRALSLKEKRSLLLQAFNDLAMGKGEEIIFVGGKYQGKRGWIDGAKARTAARVHVIVDLGDEKKHTFVAPESVKSITVLEDPSSFEEAMINQHPDMDQLLTKLARLMVSCRCGEQSAAVVGDLLREKIKYQRTKQAMLGNKAKWRDVYFPSAEERAERAAARAMEVLNNT